jgi:hypothetical protein
VGKGDYLAEESYASILDCIDKIPAGMGKNNIFFIYIPNQGNSEILRNGLMLGGVNSGSNK